MEIEEDAQIRDYISEEHEEALAMEATERIEKPKSMKDKGFEIRDGTPTTNSHWKNLTGKKQIILVDFDHTITARESMKE